MMASMQQTSDTWIEIGSKEEIPMLGSRVVNTDQGQIAVFRNREDEVFALLNRCPHKGGPLSEGIIYGRTVACPMHNWCIGLHNGEAVAPDEGCTPAYPVEERDGSLYLGLVPLGKCD